MRIPIAGNAKSCAFGLVPNLSNACGLVWTKYFIYFSIIANFQDLPEPVIINIFNCISYKPNEGPILKMILPLLGVNSPWRYCGVSLAYGKLFLEYLLMGGIYKLGHKNHLVGVIMVLK